MKPARRTICKAWLSGLLLACAPLALRAQAVSAPPASAPAIRIGVSLALSGRYAVLGDMQAKAYRLWERDVNARGGILGRRVEMVIRDDRSSPKTAQEIYNEFMERDRLDFVFGPYSSEITAAVAPLVEKQGYPTLAPGASSEEIWRRGYRNVIGMLPGAGRFTVGMLALLADAGIKSVAVIALDDVFSQSAAEGTKRWAPHYGLRIASYAVLPRANLDLDGAVKAAQGSGAQALLLTGYADEAVRVRLVLQRLGWSPDAYYAAVGAAVPQYHEQLGAQAHKTFSTSMWEPREDLRYPKAPEFLAQFRAAYGIDPSYQAAVAYAAGQVLEAAIAAAGTVARGKVRDALFALDMTTLAGRYAVDASGTQVKQMPMIVQWQGQRREIVWPAELKTAAPLIRQ